MHALAITEQGAHLHLQGDILLIQKAQKVVRRVRLGEVHQVLLFGRVEITSATLAALVRRKIDVVFLSQQGYFRARVVGRDSPQAQLRLTQVRRALEPEFCAKVSRGFITGKVNHQRQLLLRAQRRLRDDELADVLGRLRLLVEQCQHETDLDRLRGLEGQAAALYFGQFGKLIRVSEFTFSGRSRRPPRDPVNACLSFGYTLFGTAAETEVYRCGLDPMVGFFHQPQHNRPSLMLDLIEEFRPFIDAVVLRLINRRQLGPIDFEQHTGQSLEEILAELPMDEAASDDAADPAPAGDPNPSVGIYLGEVGRRIFLKEFFRRLRERLYYPPRNGAFELREILRQQVYHLARVINGQDADYVPFVPA